LIVEKTYESPECRLNYAEGPDNGPPLLLLHGGQDRWQDYLPLMSVLYTRWHLYALDFRGHGRSEHTPGKYSLRSFTSDVATFAELKIGKPMMLVGHSMGGIVSLMVAANHPNLVKALVLGDAPPKESLRAAAMHPLFTLTHQVVKSGGSFTDMYRDQESIGVEIPSHGLIRLADIRDGPSMIRNAKAMTQTDPEMYNVMMPGEQFTAWIEGYETDLILPKIGCPVLFIRGNPELGGMVPDADLRKLKDVVKDLIVYECRSLGHNVLNGFDEGMIRAVTYYLEAVR